MFNKIIIFLFIIFFELESYYNLITKTENLSKTFNYLFIGLIFVVNILILLLIKLNKKTKKIESKFVLVGFFIGFIYLLSIPMMKGTDEIPHFFRAYEISKGNIIIKNPDKDTTNIPENLIKYGDPSDLSFYKKSTLFEKQSDKIVKMKNRGPSHYPPFQYMPQVLAIIISNILDFGPFLMFYLIRLINLVSWLAISYFAIKRMPIKKEFVTILYLAPSLLSLMSTMSGDNILNSCSLLFIAIMTDYIYTRKQIDKKDIPLIVLLTVILSTIKIVYTPILLLCFLLKKEQFSNSKINKNVFSIIILLIGFISAITWNSISKSIIVNDGINYQNLQIEFILSNPLEYLIIFFSTFTNEFYYYVTNIVAGNEMCLCVANINPLLVIGYFSILVYSYFFDKNNLNISYFTKSAIWFIFLLILGAIATVMYIDWTISFGGIGYHKIVGVQSRYFILLVPILMLTFPQIKNNAKNKSLLWNSCIVLNGLILLNTIGTLISTYMNLL